jgi:hypothetical protein
LSAGGETAGAHFLSTLSLCSLSVGVKDGVSFGWTHLAGLDSGGISLRHLAAFAGHDDWLEVGLVGWLEVWVMVVVIWMWKLKISLVIYCKKERSESRYLCLSRLPLHALRCESTSTVLFSGYTEALGEAIVQRSNHELPIVLD